MWDFKASGNIICFGSIIMDISIKCSEFPKIGETKYTSYDYQIVPGGKGANQAIAAARLGGNVKIIGKIAQDNYGKDMKAHLEKDDVDTSLLLEDKENKSGVAFVWIDQNGNNQIICSPAINMHNTKIELERTLQIIQPGDIFLVTMEFPKEVLISAIRIAKERGALVIVDPSSSECKELDEEIAKYIDIIKPNEVEINYLVGRKVNNVENALDALSKKGVSYPLISLGEEGVIYKVNQQLIYESGIPVNAIDSTAAGDTFLGALACRLSKGDSLIDAVKYGNKAAAICVQKMGAQSSIPFAKDVNKSIKR